MKRNSIASHLSPFLGYLAKFDDTVSDRLPPLNELSRNLGISIASLREQLEVARVMGLVEVRPKTGLRKLPYRLTPGLSQSLAYALEIDEGNFLEFSNLRNHIETSFWFQAVALLREEDHDQLRRFIKTAKVKLAGSPIQIPHAEHKGLHLGIYRRLANPFVTGILETYWEMYEAEGLDLYADLHYLRKVWDYHELMVDSLCAGDFQKGYQALIDHIDLITHRSTQVRTGNFE